MYAWNQNNTYQKSPPPSAPQQPPLPLSYGQQVPPQYGQYVTGVPVVQSTSPASWSTGLCDCLDDVPNCCLTFWCPCITFGQIAEILDRRTTSCGVHGPLYTLIALLTGCECIYSCTYRSEMRQQYKLPESLCNDICLHCCCHPCALYQEYIELKNREFDMDIGWQGNMERQNQGIVMPPMAPGGMTCLIGEITVND